MNNSDSFARRVNAELDAATDDGIEALGGAEAGGWLAGFRALVEVLDARLEAVADDAGIPAAELDRLLLAEQRGCTDRRRTRHQGRRDWHVEEPLGSFHGDWS